MSRWAGSLRRNWRKWRRNGRPQKQKRPKPQSRRCDLASAVDPAPDALDNGPSGVADRPVRRCLATGERKPQSALIRFVLGPDDTVVPDLAAKLPGRGMWLSADAGSIKTALDRKLFARAARAPALAPLDLPQRVEALLARRCIKALSLARRAGEAVCGYEKTRAALAAKTVAALLQARDGSLDRRAKLAALTGGSTPVVTPLTAAELGEAFGRETAVHVALAPGGLAQRFLTDAARLAGFRPIASGAVLDGKDDV